MSQSSTLFIGMDVHKDSIAVAYVAQEHGAEVASLGTLGTRQCAIAQRLRTRPSTAPPRRWRSAAGPCGDWRARALTNQGDEGWGGRQRCAPQTSGDRVTTDRRAAVPLVAALGALPRFARPRARRQVLGLLPAAPASGAPRRQGAMPPAGPSPT